MSFKSPAGIKSFRIVVRKIGFGATGTFELFPGEIAGAAAAAAALSCAIEGVVPKDVLKRGTYLLLHDPFENKEVRAQCDNSGRFVMEDVPCGIHWLQPRLGEQTLEVAASVCSGPGNG